VEIEEFEEISAQYPGEELSSPAAAAAATSGGS
jgi:hypothetical protein